MCKRLSHVGDFAEDEGFATQLWGFETRHPVLEVPEIRPGALAQLHHMKHGLFKQLQNEARPVVT